MTKELIFGFQILNLIDPPKQPLALLINVLVFQIKLLSFQHQKENESDIGKTDSANVKKLTLKYVYLIFSNFKKWQ